MRAVVCRAIRLPRPAFPIRAYATSQFVPPSSSRDIDPAPSSSLPKPTSLSFFTARPRYYDTVATLETAKKNIRHALTDACLLPVSAKRVEYLRLAKPPAWKPAKELETTIGISLRTSHYSEVVKLLNELYVYKGIAVSGELNHLVAQIDGVISGFERDDKEVHSENKRKPTKIDHHGRSYTLGKRKESAARVWMIHTRRPDLRRSNAQNPPPSRILASLSPEEQSHATPEILARADPAFSPPVSQILINNVPLATYFSAVADREKVTEPLRVTGSLGKYNVFTLVRGGGTTGQAGAIAHGIAQGLLALYPLVRPMLEKGA